MNKEKLTPRKAVELYRIGLIVSVVLAVLMGFLYQFEILTQPAFLIIALIPVLAGTAIYQKYGKCPGCGRQVSTRYRKDDGRCPKCGASLEGK